MSPYVSLDHNWSYSILPVMKLTFIMRNEFDDTIVTLKGKMRNTFAHRGIKICLEARASRYRQYTSTWHACSSSNKNRGKKDCEYGESNVHHPLGSHFLEVIKHVKFFTGKRNIYLMAIELFLGIIILGVCSWPEFRRGDLVFVVGLKYHPNRSDNSGHRWFKHFIIS